MLSENIRTIRRSKGLSQEELAGRLNVVRQTISKWEQGLSVPDSDMLISLSEALDTPVSVLLEEVVEEKEANDIKLISERLEIINMQLAINRETKRKKLLILFGLTIAAVIAAWIILIIFGSPYLNWNYNDPEIAVVGVLLHGFEWFFVRLSPFVLFGVIIGLCITWRKNKNIV